MASTKPIQRITLFKIPNAEDQDKLLEIYRHMPQKAVKVGGLPFLHALLTYFEIANMSSRPGWKAIYSRRQTRPGVS